MEKVSRIVLQALVVTLLFVFEASGQTISDFLITSDIDGFIASKNPTSGEGPGTLAIAKHYYLDHKDTTYRGSYFNVTTRVGPTIQITQHAGTDSDKWLSHEIDFDFRNYYGIPGRSYGPKQIDGQTILEDAVGGRSYRWLSGNKVIMIQYRDSQMTKPEPSEVVRAYLAKHPSTLAPMGLAELRSLENKTKWIKDEIERRLWLCDKRFLQLQMGKAELSDVLQTVVKHLEVFLNYRERYYGPKALDDRKALFGYLETKDGTSVKTKLLDYKTWWSVNKTRSISVP